MTRSVSPLGRELALLAALCVATLTAASRAEEPPAPLLDEQSLPLRDQLGLPPAYRPILAQQSEVWANVHGGLTQKVVYTGLLIFGAELDLDAAGWVPGGSVSVVGVGIQGGNVSPEAVGDDGIASNIAGVPTVRLFRAWYRQRLAADAVDVKLGILPLDDDFMVVDSALLFINSGFGTAQTEALNTPAGIYPLAGLGARLSLLLDEDWKLKLGAYDGDAGDPHEHSHISKLSWTGDGGAILLGELTWQTRPAGRDLRLSLGGFGHTGRFRDYRTSRNERGLGSVYLMGEHALARWSASTLWLFSHAGVAFPTPRTTSDVYADAGLVFDGAAWSRPDDRFGLGAAWTGFSSAKAAWLRRGAPGREPEPSTAGEAVVELTYESTLWPWLRMQPSVQWHRRPRAALEDAWLMGIRATLSL